jgi:hypothetical protein
MEALTRKLESSSWSIPPHHHCPPVARSYVGITLKVAVHLYRHHVLVLPPHLPTWMGAACNWAGNAVIGFATPAWTYVWVNGDFWNMPQASEALGGGDGEALK